MWYVGIEHDDLTALALRQIYPSKTLACRLPGVRREFYGFSGMATWYTIQIAKRMRLRWISR